MLVFRSLPRSLQSLIVNSTIVAFGSFLVTPFLGIFLKLSLHLDTKVVGLLMAFSTFTQFGGGLVGAMVAERMGLKRAMVFALSFRSIGFVLLARSPGQHALILPALFLVAAGSALYLPANRAYIISSVEENLKPFFISVSNASLSAGMAAGPLAAALLVDQNPSLLFYLVAGLFIVLAVVHKLTLKLDTKAISKTSFAGLPEAFTKTAGPVLQSTVTYYLYFFFQSFIGLYLATMMNTQLFAALVFCNMVLLAIVQPLFARRIAAQDYRKLLTAGFALLAVGFALFACRAVPAMILGTLVMTIGQAILVLRGDVEVVRRLPQSPALAFGLQRLATGTGGLFTGIIGGFAYDYFQRGQTLSEFWLFVSVNALAPAAVVWFALRKKEVSVRVAA